MATRSEGGGRWHAALHKLTERSALLLGLSTIGLLWVGVAYHIADERRVVEIAVQQNTSNLARVFEEHIALAMKELDEPLLLVREASEGDPRVFVCVAGAGHPYFTRGLTLQISIIDRDGRLLMSNLGNV